VQKASVFDSKVYIASGDKKVNAKSIMGMMSLGLLKGETLTVITDGDDEKEALESIDSFLSGNDKED
jgi:phosphotransferase system HPr (HPr) family protein